MTRRESMPLIDRTEKLKDRFYDYFNMKYFNWRDFKRLAGPGWLMSIAYLDPGNLESDIQAAALCGNKLLWILFWAHVSGFFIQSLASQLAIATNKNLAQHINEHYSFRVSRVIWFMTEIAIIGSDIQEVIGSAIAINIIFSIPIWIACILTVVQTMGILAVDNIKKSLLEKILFGMLFLMALCFYYEMIMISPSINSIVEGIVKIDIPRGAFVQASAMVGAIIMPHNIYLHSALVIKNIKEDIESNDMILDEPNDKIEKYNFYHNLESALALFTSFTINLAVMVVFSEIFYYRKQPSILDVGLNDAAPALRESLGYVAELIWAAGLLAAGQSSTITGTLAGQYVMEGFWKMEINPALRAAITRAISLVPTLFVAVLAINHLDTLGEYLNSLQSLQLPFALIPILRLTFDKKIMGQYVIKGKTAFILKLISLGILIVNIYLLKNIIDELIFGIFSMLIVLLFVVLYFGFIFYLCFKNIRNYS